MARQKLIPNAVNASFGPPDKMAGQAFYPAFSSQCPDRAEEKRVIIFNNVTPAFRAFNGRGAPESIPQLTE